MLAGVRRLCNIAVLPFQPKYRLGHPENDVFLVSKNIFIRSKVYPTKKIKKTDGLPIDTCVIVWLNTQDLRSRNKFLSRIRFTQNSLKVEQQESLLLRVVAGSLSPPWNHVVTFVMLQKRSPVCWHWYVCYNDAVRMSGCCFAACHAKKKPLNYLSQLTLTNFAAAVRWSRYYFHCLQSHVTLQKSLLVCWCVTTMRCGRRETARRKLEEGCNAKAKFLQEHRQKHPEGDNPKTVSGQR